MARRSYRKADPPKPSPSSAALVLLVDDAEDNRRMYRQFLEWAGFRVVEAIDGVEALQQVATLLPDVIVMDLSLPRLDGWEVTRRLKADDGTTKIPIVALTAHVLSGEDGRATQAGCEGYLAKPCLPEDLVKEIRRILTRGRDGADGGLRKASKTGP
jgi:two-component system, cell cycle response regulator DivK